MRLDQFAGLALVGAATPELPGLVLLRDRRDHDLVPVLLRLHVASQVIVMEPLHHADDGALLAMVEPGGNRVVVAVLDLLAGDLRIDLLTLVGIVQDDEVGAAPQHASVDGGGEPTAADRSLPFELPVGHNRPALGEHPVEPVRAHHPVELDRLGLCNLLAVGHA
jgi:hypothetical protein